MSRTKLIGIVLSACGGAALAGLLIALVTRLGVRGGVARSTSATSWGWLLVALAGLVILGVGWLLLRSAPVGTQTPPVHESDGRCSSCGGHVRSEWRLCPHCGVVAGDRDSAHTL